LEEELSVVNSNYETTSSIKTQPKIEVDVVKPLNNFSRETRNALDDRPYFVHVKDMVITKRITELNIGDVLLFDRVREIGSRDFILRGSPYIHPEIMSIRAVVIEHPISSDIQRSKHMRRGRDRVVHNKDNYTVLRITDISIKQA
ncbi:aconitate hydratase, partial [Nowakowskiella sp. JEL0078]